MGSLRSRSFKFFDHNHNGAGRWSLTHSRHIPSEQLSKVTLIQYRAIDNFH